jgi:hypothetical protein
MVRRASDVWAAAERLRVQFALVGAAVVVGALTVSLMDSSRRDGLERRLARRVGARQRLRQRARRAVREEQCPAALAPVDADATRDAAERDAAGLAGAENTGRRHAAQGAARVVHAREHVASLLGRSSGGVVSVVARPGAARHDRAARHRGRAAEGRFQRRLRALGYLRLSPALAPACVLFPEALVGSEGGRARLDWEQPAAKRRLSALLARARRARLPFVLPRLTERLQGAIAVVLLLVVGLVGYVVFVAPKRSAAAELAAQVQTVQAELAERQPTRSVGAPALSVAEIFAATRAMPDNAEMPEVMLELIGLAGASGVSIESIAPKPAVEHNGQQATPIAMTAEGRYFQLSAFLARLRQLVRIERGRLKASGRLYAVDTVSFAEGREGFPNIRASITVNALMYDRTAAERKS